MNDLDQVAMRPTRAVMAPDSTAPGPARPGRALLGGAVAMAFVGGSVAVSSTLVGTPVLTGQALRYGLASVLLVAILRFGPWSGRRPIPRPRGRQWLWLLAVTGCGLVLFNLALIWGSRHAEPAVLGVAVACVPLALAVVGPLLEGAPPARRVLVAAAVVTLGAVLVEGFGRSDGWGLLWAVVVFGCEAGFTLCAVPLLGALGAHGVSVHATWLAAVIFAVLGVVVEGPTALTRLSPADLLALAYLAVAVTALAFVLWYGCVHSVGAGRAGLLTGVAPVVAAAGGVALGGPVPGGPVWIGVLVVGLGLLIGFQGSRDRRADVDRRVAAPVGRRTVQTRPRSSDRRASGCRFSASRSPRKIQHGS